MATPKRGRTDTAGFRARVIGLAHQSEALAELALEGDPPDRPGAVSQAQLLLRVARIVAVAQLALEGDERHCDLLDALEKVARPYFRDSRLVRSRPYLAGSEPDGELGFLESMKRLLEAVRKRIAEGDVRAFRVEFIGDVTMFVAAARFPGVSRNLRTVTRRLAATFTEEDWPPQARTGNSLARQVLRAVGVPEERVRKFGKSVGRRQQRKAARRATK